MRTRRGWKRSARPLAALLAFLFASGAQAAAVLSYGVAETVDLQAGVSWLDTGPEQGAGDSLAAVKWRFWENEAWSLANGRATWAALLTGQHEGERWIFLSRLGYRRNRNTLGNREALAEISGAALRNIVVGAIYSVSKDMNLDVGLRDGNDPAIDRALMLGVTLRW